MSRKNIVTLKKTNGEKFQVAICDKIAIVKMECRPWPYPAEEEETGDGEGGNRARVSR